MRRLWQEDADSTGISLVDAYEELPRWAFGLWVRMMAEDPYVLQTETMVELAKRFGCSYVWLYRFFLLLKRTGYLRIVTRPNGRRRFFFAKRPMLLSPNQFVKF